MSESLAWEKWSSFSHNRYVEEAERYSRPGSVAQKKAFFEAHYKKLAAQKAAALLEQANNAAQNNATGQEDGEVIDNDTHDSHTSPNHEMVVKEEKDAKVLSLTSEPDTMVSATSQDLDSNIEASIVSESSKIEEAGPEMGQAAVIENSMEVGLQNQLEDVDAHKEQNETPPIMTPLVKQVPNSDQEVLASTGKKKPPVSSFKLLKANGTSKMDKASIIKDAIEYIQHLHEQEKMIQAEIMELESGMPKNNNPSYDF
ncbi:Myc-type, basic helix-loop-helix [Sesbania bispinosa]|nr:Myc-type, basic helix-loop-helix [Sesbania bispinosa]